MAKLGEGDKRWIVEERADGANVHNWHWSERDCLDWSRSLLSSLLSDLQILDGEGGLYIRTKSIDKVEGEAYVNVRKGKVIPGYELSIKLAWEAEARDVPLKLSGLVEVPYLADENAGEDPELKVSVRDDDGPVARRIKDAMLAKGKPIILEKIRLYVDAMSKGGPAKDELDTKKPPSNAASKAAPAPAPAPATATKTAAATEQKEKEKKEKKKSKEGFKNISLTEKFYCRARDLYEILMDENRWKGFTQSNARLSREVGGQFSLFDGSITGFHEELQEGKLIVQKWRSGSWPDGLYSSVKIVFDEPEPGVTIIKLTQTDIPEEDKYGNSTVVENTERGWRELIFHKIRAVFGFGS
ncbi:Activator of 90 kDa heat shock protein ATPase [Rhynchospora pubera]|uniref:Activator of 90 kDa heat shock protein ATPase n=1 Tax=Rhynchospora pubera TaxID=906938 RepID=A0AAV8FTA1_9POAL|nr:Activator of 90 kDa heat shock protein ATPase [Rhynchospora pubera]